MLKWYIFLLFNICTYGDNFTTKSQSYTDMIHIPEYYGSGSTSGFDPGSGSNKSIVIHHDEPNKESDIKSKVIYGVSILLFSVSVFFILYGLYFTPKPTKTDETIETHSFSNPLFNFDDLDENDDEPLYQPNIGIPKYAMYNDDFDYDFYESEI